MATIFSVFRKFPKETELIGHLLAGYSILEIDLLYCVSVVRDDFDTALKVMFRPRGETNRINIADAFGRQYYSDLGLASDFDDAIKTVKYCLRIRNQYAHCIWWNNYSGKLAFANLEDAAKTNMLVTDLRQLTPQCVDLQLLKSQEAYFEYADDYLMYLNFEGRKGTTPPPPAFTKPPVLTPPPLSLSC